MKLQRKTCAACGIEKPATDFSPYTYDKTKTRLKCRTCVNKAQRDAYQRATGTQRPYRPHPSAAADRIVNDTGRTCTLCGRFKPWSAFNVMKKGINGYCPQCRDCVNNRRTP
jgi:hypothetical protein